MEEKERYEIHIYDDICVDLYDNGVLDKSINDTYKLEELLNQQSKRIKELEEELDDAKRDYIPKLEFGLQRANKMGRDTEKENQQLKEQLSKKEETLKHIMSGEYIPANIAEKTLKLSEQSQKQLAIEELEKLKEKAFHFYVNDTPELTSFYVDVKEIDNQIKSLRGEE